MSSIIDDIRKPSAWNTAIPIFKAIWSMLVYECIQHDAEKVDKKQIVNVLDRVDGSSEYKLKQIKLRKCEGLEVFLESDDLEKRAMIYSMLKLDDQIAEHIFDSHEPLYFDENNNKICLDDKFEIILLAVIYWFKNLSKEEMHKYDDELQIVVESIVFMAVYQKKTIDIELKTKNKPIITKDSDSSMFMMHAIAEIRCILVALNQLNKITDDPFKTFDVELWKGNALENIIRFRIENRDADLEVLLENEDLLKNQYGACIIAIEQCVA